MANTPAPTLGATAPNVARMEARKQAAPQPAFLAPTTLSVIIVNYCQWRNTSRLTRQLRRSHAARAGEAEIVIVDNHSPPHRLRNRLRRLNGVTLRRFRCNCGFARAVNAGHRISRGEWLLLLNPDVTVPQGFLDDLDLFIHGQTQANPGVGIIGLGVQNADGSAQPSCGPLPTLGRTMTGLLLPRSQRKCRVIEGANQTEVAWATGCALLIRRDCFDEIGGFDERFFLYYEDVDLCRRATERGWKVRFEPNLQVRHHTPLHSRATPAPLRLMTRHALLSYGLKHWPRWQSFLLGGLICVESVARQTLAWWRGRDADAHFHGQVRRIVGELMNGRQGLAQARIYKAAAHLESVASAQDGKTC